MPKLNLLLVSGEEEEDLPITESEAREIRNGFMKGDPFSFTDAEGIWVWFYPDKFAMVSIEED